MKLGCLAYINALPVTWGLESGAVAPGTEVVAAEPSQLNALTLRGELDVTPVSSIQWLHCHERYRAVPGVALSSRGTVQSVKLFSRVPISQLAGKPVAITSATATSRILLQILVPGIVLVPLDGKPDLTKELPACLLIGDQALLGAPPADHELDLGQAWLERTGLPMVFAMWLTKRDHLAEAAALLSASQQWGSEHRGEVIAEAARRTGLTKERLDDYYRGLYFHVGEAEQQGLFEYYHQAARLGLAPEVPEAMLREFARSPAACSGGRK